MDPESLHPHHYEDDSSELDVNYDDNLSVQDDMYTLRYYSLIRMRDAAGEQVGIHQPLTAVDKKMASVELAFGELQEEICFQHVGGFFERPVRGQDVSSATAHAQAVLAYPPATNEYVVSYTAWRCSTTPGGISEPKWTN